MELKFCGVERSPLIALTCATRTMGEWIFHTWKRALRFVFAQTSTSYPILSRPNSKSLGGSACLQAYLQASLASSKQLQSISCWRQCGRSGVQKLYAINIGPPTNSRERQNSIRNPIQKLAIVSLFSCLLTPT